MGESPYGGPSRVEMMAEIDRVWRDPVTPEELAMALWSLQDGCGEPGFIPTQGYDWSGIRDSSEEAVRAMYAAIHV